MERGAWWARVHWGHRSDMTEHTCTLKRYWFKQKKKKRERDLIYILRGSFLGGGEKGRLHQLKRVYILNFRSLGGSDRKESACSVGDLDSIPVLGRSPGEGNGNPLQYSRLKNPMDGRA